jgi:hypothetical protein
MTAQETVITWPGHVLEIIHSFEAVYTRRHDDMEIHNMEIHNMEIHNMEIHNMDFRHNDDNNRSNKSWNSMSEPT